jgi:cytochrome c-type biogenesis protein CcmH
MSIIFIVPLVLSIVLVSFLAWRAVGDAVLLLARRQGERRMRVAMSALAALVIASGAGATWLFTAQAKQTAAMTADSVAATPASAPAPRGGDLVQLVDRLDERLKREPGDAPGWALFARTQLELQRYPEAARAYARAVTMLPNEADLWVEFANAELMASSRKWTQPAIDATEAALALNPEHLEALWLAGTYRFEKKDYSGAVRSWEKLLRIAPADSDYARDLATTMVEARALRDGKDPAAAIAAAGIGARPLAAAGSPSAVANPSGALSGTRSLEKESLARELQSTLDAMAGASTPAAPGNRISGEVRLSPDLRAGIAPDAAIFVFARAEDMDKAAMPLAARRFRVADLPIRFDFGDNDAMSPDFKLSSARRVVIIARISRSGDARAQAGDLEGASRAVASGTDGVAVLINKPL